MRTINPLPGLVVGAMLAAFITPSVGVSAASAQQSGTPAPTVGTLLQQNPNGGSQLANVVQQLALSNPSNFDALIGLVANANDQQKSAIAQGLTRAAKIEVLTNQTLAQQWESQIAAINDPAFKIAASDALGDVKLGSVGGAAGGSAGAGLGGSGGGGGGGSAQNVGTGGTPVTTNNFTTSAFTTSANTTGSSGISNSVSASR